MIIHTTEDPSANATCLTTQNYFQYENPYHVSAHYIICQDGTVVQMVRHSDIAHHAGNWEYNKRSIGIEHERHGNLNITEAQYQASHDLVTWLQQQYGYPVVHFLSGLAPQDPAAGGGTIGHCQVPDPSDSTKGGGHCHKGDPLLWDWPWYIQHFGLAPPGPICPQQQSSAAAQTCPACSENEEACCYDYVCNLGEDCPTTCPADCGSCIPTMSAWGLAVLLLLLLSAGTVLLIRRATVPSV